MNRETYDALPGENFSRLKFLSKSPASYRAAMKTPPEATDAMTLGAVAHLATLEPETLTERVAVWADGTRRGKSWDSFEAANAGKLIVKTDDYEKAMAMARAIRASPMAAPYVTGGKAEVSVQWEEMGVQLKGRIDYLTPSCVVDVKFTRDASPEAFGRQMFASLVHAQLAMYRAGEGHSLPCALVACENTGTNIVQVYRLTEEHLEQGTKEYRAWLATLRACQTSGLWPGYWTEPMDLQFPRWANPEENYE